ncbi:MAG TPA: deoxyribodipyrimidine photo-lyase [Bacteroidetes bacterium]|nr:deoxyribodipyrimidine photo-lyase [Bacteroidota bacterium]
MRVIHWFRRDLRVHDNPALQRACRIGDEVIGLVVLHPSTIDRTKQLPRRLRFLLLQIEALKDSLARIGGRLVLRYGLPEHAVPNVVQEWGAKWVTWNEDIEHTDSDRDERIRQSLSAMGCYSGIEQDQYLVPLSVLKASRKEPIQTFEVFYKVWRTHLSEASSSSGEPAPEPLKAGRTISPKSDPFPISTQFHVASDKALPPPGEQPAIRRLERWIEILATPPSPQPAEKRVSPSAAVSSGISPYLRFGVLSIRQCMDAARPLLNQRAREMTRTAAELWVARLARREYYNYLFFHFPRVMQEPFNIELSTIRWETNQAHLTAWKEGKTGYPIVDAAMRQMAIEGYAPQWAREIAAHFYIKDLMLDWRQGMNIFYSLMLDADMANNVGNWQRVASFTPDADPFWRVPNPARFSREMDPSGEYIRRYVPELVRLPKEYVHEPWTLPHRGQTALRFFVGQDYPVPIVSHDQRREEIIRRYRTASHSE